MSVLRNSFMSCLVWRKGGNKTQNKQVSVNEVVGSSAGKARSGGCLKGQPEVSHINTKKYMIKYTFFPPMLLFYPELSERKENDKERNWGHGVPEYKIMKVETLSHLPCFIPEPRIVKGIQIFWGCINKCLACDKPCAWYFTYINSFKSHTYTRMRKLR